LQDIAAVAEYRRARFSFAARVTEITGEFAFNAIGVCRQF
jgi:hypothetical protein